MQTKAPTNGRHSVAWFGGLQSDATDNLDLTKKLIYQIGLSAGFLNTASLGKESFDNYFNRGIKVPTLDGIRQTVADDLIFDRVFHP
jgi:hypothetical protein